MSQVLPGGIAGSLTLVAIGLVALTLGADLLVGGAARLAGRFGISPLVIGLTLVAFGTSAPELAVSLGAAWSGRPDLALGNVVGSNTFNLLVIAALSALVRPLHVDRSLLRRDLPAMVLSAGAMQLMVLDLRVSRLEGVTLLVIGVLWIVSLTRGARERDESAPEDGGRPWSAGRALVLMLLGLGGLVIGANLLVEGASALARSMGTSELVIGLTVVAAGTSLPELATSLAATRRGQREIAVGNVVGSNLFNVLAVLGGSSAIGGDIAVATQARQFDVPFMVAISILAAIAFASSLRLSRLEGAVLFALYSTYTVVMIMVSSSVAPVTEGLTGPVVVLLAVLLAASVIVIVISWRERGAKPETPGMKRR